MTTLPRRADQANPFSTRFVRPGEVEYRFPPGDSAEHLVERLAAAGWRGQIIGPHGSGKSALVASLHEALARAGRPAWTIALRDRQRRLPRDWEIQAAQATAGLIVVDGYEQLGRWARAMLKRRCRKRGWGLLVTAHSDVGLPTLLLTAPSVELRKPSWRRS